MTVPAIVLDALRVVRGGRLVLRDVSCQVATARVTGLIGPSGCGKTTLMRSVVGVQVIAAGAARVLGEPAGAPALRDRIGYMTQAPSVYGDLTVGENLRYFARVLGAPGRRVEETISAVSLADHADQVVDHLSGGQRARVSLAVALLNRPSVLVLDEPTVGLDPVLRRDLWDLFHEFAQRGDTVLVSSHVMDEAERCDELIVLRDGAVLATGSPEQLRRRTGASGLDAAFLALVEQHRES